MPTRKPKIGVFCADDGAIIQMSLELQFSTCQPHYEWKGSLYCADDLAETVEQINRLAARDGSTPVNVVILDINMPGKCSFVAAAELVARCPEARIVFFSGAPCAENFVRAQQAAPGSIWVNKGEGCGPLLAAIASQHA